MGGLGVSGVLNWEFGGEGVAVRGFFLLGGSWSGKAASTY